MASKAVPTLVLLFLVNTICSKELGLSSHAYLGQLYEKVGRLEEQMQRLQTNVAAAPEETQSSGIQIAFFATMMIQRKTYNTGDTVQFENVITNIGNDYDPTTGVFRAPAPGTYFFQASILSDNGVEIWAYFTVNGVSKSSVNARGVSGRHGSGTQALLVTLNHNDVVKLVNSRSNGKYYGRGYTSFAGYLL